jgi:hypothetical protein
MAEHQQPSQSYSPVALADLQKVFDRAWAHLVTTGSPLAEASRAARTRDVLAREVISCGERGLAHDDMMARVLASINASPAED